MALALLAASCVNDDSDLDALLAAGGKSQPDEETVVPVEIEWDESELAEDADVPVTDPTDPAYNDYEENGTWSYTVYVAYDGDDVQVTGNTSRVTVTHDGAHVTIVSTRTNINYVLSGQSDNGSFKIYSDHKFKLTLNGLTLTNPNGAAINNQGGKSLYLVLADGTTNALADGTTYADVADEDQKGTFFSEGQIIVSGHGKLNVTATGRHGLVSDDYIRVRPGSRISISATSGHGIKVNDGLWIDGGVLNVTTSAAGAKGIKSDAPIAVSGGRTTIITTGGVAITPATTTLPADTSACAAIKCDSAITVTAGALLLKSTGEGGKGINTNTDLTISGGKVTVVTTGIKGNASPKGIRSDGTTTITGGYVYSYSAAASPLDAAGGLVLATGCATYETLARRVIVSYE